MMEPDQQRVVQRLPAIVVLTGFRATGKTAVGKILADLLGYRFVDTDTEITDRLGCSIAESVQQHGWKPFRDLERQVLQELLDQKEAVYSTGGGAVIHREAWQKLHDHAFVVWLRADHVTILTRLRADEKTAQQRPSLSGRDLETEIPVLLAEREPLYRAGSDMALDTESSTPAELARTIFQQLTAG